MGDPSQQSHIDYIFGPSSQMEERYQYVSWSSLSDHLCVIAKLCPNESRGPSQWQFPGDILDNLTQVQAFYELLTNPPNFDDVQVQWEAIKMGIRDISQEWTKFCKKQKRSEIASLHRLLHGVNNRMYQGEDMLYDQQRIQSKIRELE